MYVVSHVCMTKVLVPVEKVCVWDGTETQDQDQDSILHKCVVYDV